MRLKGLIAVIVGVLVVAAGYGMYKSPHLDWDGFIQAFPGAYSVLLDEINYFVNDPLALIGIIVMAVGLITVLKGVQIIQHKQTRRIIREEPAPEIQS